MVIFQRTYRLARLEKCIRLRITPFYYCCSFVTSARLFLSISSRNVRSEITISNRLMARAPTATTRRRLTCSKSTRFRWKGYGIIWFSDTYFWHASYTVCVVIVSRNHPSSNSLCVPIRRSVKMSNHENVKILRIYYKKKYVFLRLLKKKIPPINFPKPDVFHFFFNTFFGQIKMLWNLSLKAFSFFFIQSLGLVNKFERIFFNVMIFWG